MNNNCGEGTLYVPTHKTGMRALPKATMTEANCYILEQTCPKDWRVDLVNFHADAKPDAHDLAEYDRRDPSGGNGG